MCKFIFLPFFLSLVCFSISGNAYAQSKKPQFIIGIDYRPHGIFPPINGLRGYDVEVVEAAFKHSGVEVEILSIPWKRGLELTKKGVYAGAIACAYRKNRIPYLAYTEKISRSTRSFFMRKDFQPEKIQSLNDFEGLKARAVLGTSLHEALKKHTPDLVTHYTVKEALLHLIDKKYDYFLSAREVAEFEAKQQGTFKNIKSADISSIDLHLCISRKWPNALALLRAFNNGLAAIRKNGIYDQIHSRY